MGGGKRDTVLIEIIIIICMKILLGVFGRIMNIL